MDSLDCEINKDLTNVLPNEIFEEILSYIEFGHLQKSCVLVCKRWFLFIRNSVKLSECVNFSLKANDINIPNLNKLLKNWPLVKDLGLYLNYDHDPITLDEESHENLNSERVRFKITKFFYAFLWPFLSPQSSIWYDEDVLSYMPSSVQVKSSFLKSGSISEVTGNKTKRRVLGFIYPQYI